MEVEKKLASFFFFCFICLCIVLLDSTNSECFKRDNMCVCRFLLHEITGSWLFIIPRCSTAFFVYVYVLMCVICVVFHGSISQPRDTFPLSFTSLHFTLPFSKQ